MDQLNDDDDGRFGYKRDLDQSQAEFSLTEVSELDGTVVAKGMQFEDWFLLQEDYFHGVAKPDDEEFNNTTENSVVYNRTGLHFIVPCFHDTNS